MGSSMHWRAGCRWSSCIDARVGLGHRAGVASLLHPLINIITGARATPGTKFGVRTRTGTTAMTGTTTTAARPAMVRLRRGRGQCRRRRGRRGPRSCGTPVPITGATGMAPTGAGCNKTLDDPYELVEAGRVAAGGRARPAFGLMREATLRPRLARTPSPGPADPTIEWADGNRLRPNLFRGSRAVHHRRCRRRVPRRCK